VKVKLKLQTPMTSAVSGCLLHGEDVLELGNAGLFCDFGGLHIRVSQ